MTKENISKILAKIMESSYRKNEIYAKINRIMDKMETLLYTNTEEVLALRKEFDSIRKDIFGS